MDQTDANSAVTSDSKSDIERRITNLSSPGRSQCPSPAQAQSPRNILTLLHRPKAYPRWMQNWLITTKKKVFGNTPNPLSPKRAPHRSIQKNREIFEAAVWTVMWMLSGSWLIMQNKSLLESGYEFPIMISAAGQFVSAAGGFILHRSGAVKVRRFKIRELTTIVLPVAFTSAITYYTGNAAYVDLSVTFIQILKGITPGLTMVIAVAMRQEVMSLSVLASMLLIGGGTGVAVLVEAGTVAFVWRGFLYFMTSAVTEALRVAFIQTMMGQHKLSSIDSLVYVSLPSGLLLLFIGLIFESNVALSHMVAHPFSHITAYTLALFTNLSGFVAQQKTSALTFKVNGYLRNYLFTLYSVYWYGEHISLLQFLGYLASGSGFVVYTMLKQKELQQAIHNNQ